MKMEGTIKQLESILDHTRSMAAESDADEIWKEDIAALEFTIAALRSMPEAGEPDEGLTMDYKKLSEKLKEMLPEKIPYGELVGAPWPYTGQGDMVYEEPEHYLMEQAATAITELLSRAEAAEERAEKAEKGRDAAVFDLIRAEKAAEETNALLDDELHPSCDYSLYLSIHDSVSEIVNWAKDGEWRGRQAAALEDLSGHKCSGLVEE